MTKWEILVVLLNDTLKIVTYYRYYFLQEKF